MFKRYPLSFVSIRFQNKYEADQTLRHFNIKTYRTGWFIIPNPRVEVIEEEEENTQEAYRVLDKLNLLDDNGNLSELDHQNTLMNIQLMKTSINVWIKVKLYISFRNL